MEERYTYPLTEYNTHNPRITFYLTMDEYIATLHRLNYAWDKKSIHHLKLAVYSIPCERKLVQEIK